MVIQYKKYQINRRVVDKMKRSIQYLYLLMIIFAAFLWAMTVSAKDIYVTGVTNITMRTGPGVSHKIVTMLKSGTKLEIIEYGKDWTQVLSASGRTGWVLSRFLTEAVPSALIVDQLRKENSGLVSKLAAVEKENREKLSAVEKENNELVNENAALLLIQQKYETLKDESAQFLELDARYKEISKEYDAQKNKIRELEENLNNDEKLWFLSGSGVLIVGLFLGLSMRKKKKSTLL